ncbi:hypothetical protein KC573_01455, partial [candidate division WWE3 bacterium]|nr:hypothetical protein [candidate division WWE3 bacterium]
MNNRKRISNYFKKLFGTQPWYKKQAREAWKLLKKLFSLKLIKFAIIAFILLLISPLILFFFLRPSTPDSFNYGVTFSNKYAHEMGMDWPQVYLKILDDLGVRNLRLVAYWDEVEPERDQYDFSAITWQLEEAQRRDIPVILIVGRKQVRWPECFEPQWWEAIEEEATQDAELFEYIKRTIIELKKFDNIVKWQVENEPFWAFGDCAGEITWETLNKEVEIVRSLDERPIVIQDSGEGGLWLPTYKAGDYLAISMYRRIWYDFWGIFLGKPIYFQYPLAHWTYKIKATLVG